MLFHRQFVQRDDYDVFVVTDRKDFASDKIPYLIHEHPRIIRRLMRTRLAPFAHDYVQFFGGSWIPPHILSAARQFRPDVVMMGAETWIADLAARLARKLRLPLAGHFMDWPTYAMLGHAWAKRHASNMFSRRYRRCDLAFGICPEMLEALGPHRNSQVFYPSGPARLPAKKNSQRPDGHRFTLFFAGNLGQWYGHMLADLARCFKSQADICLRIAGRNAEWPAELEAQLRHDGTYLGFLKGTAYQAAFEEADVLLLAMGFGEADRIVESTSFKSKLADYLATGLPIVVWGPDYCTAVRHARREHFAEVVTANDPAQVVAAVRALRNDPTRCASLVADARRFWAANLDVGKVMPQTLQAIQSLVRQRDGSRQRVSAQSVVGRQLA